MTLPGSTTVGVALLSAGTGEPSSTRLLGDRVTSKLLRILRADGSQPDLSVIELRPLAHDIIDALLGGLKTEPLEQAIAQLARAEVIVVSTPVYKAGISGLLKSFVDLLDNDLLIDKTVILAATAGTARHALVVDDQLRQLFAYFRTISAPTSIFAAPEDWTDPALSTRIERAAAEAAVLQAAGARIRDRTWAHHRHEFGASAGSDPADDVDFDTDLMRLAAGGSSRVPAPPSSTVPDQGVDA